MADLGNLVVAQFYRTTLTQSTSIDSPLITVLDSTGFPELAVGKYFYLTLVAGDSASVHRIITHNPSTGVLTADENIGIAYPASTARAEHWFTAQAFEDIQAYLTSLATDSYPGVSDPTIVADPTIRVGVIGAANIGPDAINESHIGDEQVREEHIKNGAVTSLKFGTGAVTETKIANGAVTSDKIPNGAVLIEKIEAIASGGVMGNLTGTLAPPQIVPVQADFLGNDMGGDLPGTEQTLTNQRAVYNFVIDTSNTFLAKLNYNAPPYRVPTAEITSASDVFTRASPFNSSPKRKEVTLTYTLDDFVLDDDYLTDAQRQAGWDGDRTIRVMFSTAHTFYDNGDDTSGFIEARYRIDGVGAWTSVMYESGSYDDFTEHTRYHVAEIPAGATSVEVQGISEYTESSASSFARVSLTNLITQWPIVDIP